MWTDEATPRTAGSRQHRFRAHEQRAPHGPHRFERRTAEERSAAEALQREEAGGENSIVVPTHFLNVFLTDKPIEFSFDPETGLVALVFECGFGQPGNPVTSYMPVTILLTPVSAQALQNDLPKLEAILERAKEGITKPDFLQ